MAWRRFRALHIKMWIDCICLVGASRQPERHRGQSPRASDFVAEAGAPSAHLFLRKLQPDHLTKPEGCHHGYCCWCRDPTLPGLSGCPACLPRIPVTVWPLGGKCALNYVSFFLLDHYSLENTQRRAVPFRTSCTPERCAFEYLACHRVNSRGHPNHQHQAILRGHLNHQHQAFRHFKSR